MSQPLVIKFLDTP